MSRFTRRTLAAVLGLSLGWAAAGLSLPAVHAESEPAPAAAKEAPEDAAAKPASASKAEAPESHESGHGHGAKDEGQIAAEKLVPADAESISWFRPTLGIAAALFLLALTFGAVAAISKGPPPVEPADDDHAHDAHGSGHGHGHDDKAGHGAGHAH